MAKQSFVTGQVLTAQQVNDLQTNDFNQTVSAKTASYTLVAADKGTRITMSSTSATTITVNTGLFAAGDTLFIQNLNTGVCSITAGTATVDTSASLALAQHEGGTLYFTSAGVSTFFKAAGATPGGGGKVLQVIQATTSTAIDLNTTTYTDTNITATITPTSATSKVLVMVSGTIRCFRTSSDITVINRARLMRDATAVQTRGNVLFLRARQTSDNVLAMSVPFTFNYLDNPATTSSVTYKIQGSQDEALGSFSFQYDSSPSTIILMEIGA